MEAFASHARWDYSISVKQPEKTKSYKKKLHEAYVSLHHFI